jgi:hypothetical protein
MQRMQPGAAVAQDYDFSRSTLELRQSSSIAEVSAPIQNLRIGQGVFTVHLHTSSWI